MADRDDYLRLQPWESVLVLVQGGWEDDRDYVDTTEAGEEVKIAVASLVAGWLDEWVYDLGESAPDQVQKVVESNRLSDEQKLSLLRLLGLATIEWVLPFEIALRIKVNMDAGLSGSEMAKLLGTSRQALHRKYRDLVSEIAATPLSDATTDLAYRKLREKTGG